MDRAALRKLQAAKLGELLLEIRATNAFWRRRLAGAPVDRDLLEAAARGEGPAGDPLGQILDALPLTSKGELQADQEAASPYGTNLTYGLDRYVRMHQTSGSTGRPLRWLDTAASWDWFLRCWEEVYAGAGIGRGDRVFCAFSFGPFIGFWGAFEAAVRRGCFAVPGGGLSSVARLRALLDHDITVVCCTPTYALRLTEVAEAEGFDLPASPVRRLIVAGEPGGSIEATRRRIEAAWGARVADHCGMTEVGAFGYEAEGEPGALRVIESEFIVEVLEPGSERVAEPGAEGELVITNLGRRGSPLLRYRTGDLVRWTAPEEAADERSLRGRLAGGILARLDDMVHVRGNNVHPSAVEAVVRRFREVAEYRARVVQSAGLPDLRLELEPVPGIDAIATDLVRRVTEAFRDALHFRPSVVLVEPGTLPRFELKARRFLRGDGSETGG